MGRAALPEPLLRFLRIPRLRRLTHTYLPIPTYLVTYPPTYLPTDLTN